MCINLVTLINTFIFHMTLIKLALIYGLVSKCCFNAILLEKKHINDPFDREMRIFVGSSVHLQKKILVLRFSFEAFHSDKKPLNL